MAADAGHGERDPAEQDDDAVASQTPALTTGFGFDANAAGGFPGMGFSGDFNQMQMMMAMQNGMAPGFGNFPMMGVFNLQSIYMQS